MGDIRLGTSGYSFQSWKGTAYPAEIKDSGMFDHYIDNFRLNTVELNYTYYRQPSAKGLSSMIKKSPDNFDFTVKLYGGITHEPWKNFPPTHVDTGLYNNNLVCINKGIKKGDIVALRDPTDINEESMADTIGDKNP